MDDLDRRLIALLRENARLPVSLLAKRLEVARGTVQSRLDRLVEQGEILGFTVRLRSQEAAAGVRAITLVREQAKSASSAAKALRRIIEARTIYTANGRWDLVVEMTADSLSALDEALSQIRRIEGVVSTETIILLTPLKA
jgi:DNA-binding Lrp family transcriptional regulator